MFVLGKVLSTAAVLLCILCLAAPLKKTKAGQKIKGLQIADPYGMVGLAGCRLVCFPVWC